MIKISNLGQMTTPSTTDYFPIVDAEGAPTTERLSLAELISLVFDNTPALDWTGLESVPTAVTYNGNRSYSLAVDEDRTSVISAGTRIRATRTVASPTQCTDLNGTTQYYTKSSPSGIVFTDDFVVGAWVKLEAYDANRSPVMSRFNGTSGWVLDITSTGLVRLLGYNAGAGNVSYVVSTQAVPLGRWVHIAVQLDMSAFTETPTTSYVMMDGVGVPAVVARGGTNPTALVQAGDLNVGTFNSGSGATFFNGKIAQAFVSSAKITQDNLRTLISQGLTASLIATHSIATAYSFDNSINDLNTTSANNLTPSGSAVATNADSPFGTQASGLISTTIDYGIVHSVSASTIIVQVPEGCTIPTSGGVSTVDYSSAGAPYGFPRQRGRWRIELHCKQSLAKASPSASVWYNADGSATNPLQLKIPIGEWIGGYDASYGGYRTAATSPGDMMITLSTANNSEIDKKWTTFIGVEGATGTIAIRGKGYKCLPLITTSETPTPYYLNTMTTAAATDLVVYGSLATTIIFMDNALL